jgi:GNAT superfamily N-acetyltransferase
MNIEWLAQYNLLEPADMQILNDPKKYILEPGGSIYLARVGDQIVGTAAIVPEHDGIYELVKMAVAQDFQRQGISKLLLETCLNRARAIKAKKVILFSNHQLKAALGLYERFGFKYIPVEDSPFLTADIKMELVL